MQPALGKRQRCSQSVLICSLFSLPARASLPALTDIFPISIFCFCKLPWNKSEEGTGSEEGHASLSHSCESLSPSYFPHISLNESVLFLYMLSGVYITSSFHAVSRSLENGKDAFREQDIAFLRRPDLVQTANCQTFHISSS